MFMSKRLFRYVSIWTKKRNSINNQMNCSLKFYHASERQCFLVVFIFNLAILLYFLDWETFRLMILQLM